MIIEHLNHKCLAVNRHIDVVNQTINKLCELKQSLITEAITKGFNPKVKMKKTDDSFVNEIPQHWSHIKLKYISHESDEVLTDTTDPSYVFNYVEIGNVSSSQGITSFQEVTFSESPSRARKVVHKNNIIISTVRTYLRAIAQIEQENNLIVSTGFLVIVPDSVDPTYLKYAIMSEPFVSHIVSKSCGVSYPAISGNKIMNLYIPLPPIEEQKIISSTIDKECSLIDTEISTKRQFEKKLEEYKKSLIYEFVTGKKEVSRCR